MTQEQIEDVEESVIEGTRRDKGKRKAIELSEEVSLSGLKAGTDRVVERY